ncbi:50S ribosomal protein L13 [uncultured Agathobaculum sp.]|uniref:50S ribosomal protein L13 n=1 Tax=Agathobaculum sp. TaxID=2048138 RepID=UPI001F9C5721|nr:50S ribosomal protein L13 [uncultured Agathobaculum sp.]HIV97468.1 50S ribosomal protein L13 [Candidatus Agathobaculum stercoravium]
MSTFMAKAETVERKWYVLDAAGKPLGRTAATAAMLLRGKHKAEFTPHVDCGDFVIVINADKAVLTGKKLTQKYYRHHTGWVGGLKEVQYKTLMHEKPEFAMQLAVKGMLPKNSIGRQSATRLKVYSGDSHNHQAQKPEVWDK